MGLLSLIRAGLEPVYLGEGIARGPRVAKPSPVGNKSGAPRGCPGRYEVFELSKALRQGGVFAHLIYLSMAIDLPHSMAG